MNDQIYCVVFAVAVISFIAGFFAHAMLEDTEKWIRDEERKNRNLKDKDETT